MADHGTASIPYMTYTSILNEVFVWMNGHADMFTCYIFITDYTDGSFMAIVINQLGADESSTWRQSGSIVFTLVIVHIYIKY